MPKTKDELLQEIHQEALARFDEIMEVMRAERQQCLDDRRFYSISGAQWEGALGEQFENKPKFEVNKIHLAVIKIINEYRNNRITAKYISKDGSKNDDLADTCAGLFRSDEHDSCAEEAYDNAFEEAVGGGFGALRLRTVYEDDEDPDNEKQRIRIEPIYDADASVFFDLDSKRQDKADAKFCFIVVSISLDAFKEEFDDNPADWPKDITSNWYDLSTPNDVKIAEYYLIEDHGDEMITYQGPAGDEKKIKKSELTAEDADILNTTGYVETKRRKFKRKTVHKYIISGGGILSDEGLIAGKCLPVVPAYGKRWFIDGIERCMGHVRLAKDVQRLKNMMLSKLGEISALSGISKPIFLPEQVAGFEQRWADDAVENYPYLLVNPITTADGQVQPAAAIGYTKPPEVPQALAALLQIADSDIQALLGNQQEADKMVSNIAAKTVEMIQSRMDMQTYIYVSNFAKTVRRVGEVWLSMAREIYVEEDRTMKTLGSGGETGTVTLGIPGQDPATGTLSTKNDLTKASFDVSVDVGPSSVSRRESLVRSLTGMLQVTQDPETVQVLQAAAIQNMDGEGLSDIKEYFRKKLVQMGAAKPTDEEAQAMADSAGQPSAQDLALRGMAEESEANATKARASVLKTMAEIEKLYAETTQILATTDMSAADKVSELMTKFGTAPAIVPAVQDQGAARPGAQ